MVSLSVLAMVLVSLEPTLLRELVLELERTPASPDKAALLFGLIVLTWFSALAVNRLRDIVELKTSPELRLAAQIRLYKWLDQHNAEFFRAHHSASLAQKVKQSGNAVLSLFDIIFDHQIRLFTALIMALWTLRSLPDYFLMTLIVWLCLFLPLAWWFAKRILPLSQRFGEAAAHSSGVLGDIAGNMDTVRAFNQTQAERTNFQTSLKAEKQASLRVRWFLIAMGTGLHGGQLVFQAAFVGLAVYAHTQGRIGTAELVMISSLSVILLTSVWGVTQHLQSFYDQSGILKAALQTIAQPHAVRVNTNAPALVCGAGRIEFDAVSFAYGQHTVFCGLHLSIGPKEKVGLVGPSGAGKSTLFKLLQRQFDPSTGRVLIDGQDIKDISPGSLAQAITVVPQEPALFHRSLRQNIRYGNPQASEEDLLRAIRRARCEEFIARRPEGLDAIVGERGLKLSGGERQRIAIARAFLKDSPIVLFDEATSSIDSNNESEIQSAIAEICANRTVLVIAHRLSTLQAMDQILVLDQGRVVDFADHATLLQRCPLYARLWQQQRPTAKT